MRPTLLFRALVAGAVVASCGGERGAPPEDRRAALGGEAVARVGGEAIPLSLVALVADAQRTTARDAAGKVIDDAIAASAARARGLDRQQPAAWRLVSARARMTSDRLFEEAKRKGPPTDEEVRLLSEKHWAGVDRPPSFHVIHAIALRPKDEALSADARAVGAALRAAVASATSRDEFEANAKAVAHDPKIEVRIEELPPFTDEGWVVSGGKMDETFARAAAALRTPGATSPVVETTFGWHVIRLIERLPEQRMPLEARRIAFTDEVHSLRARDLLRARLDALRASHEVTISSAAEQLMRSVTFSTPAGAEEP